MSFLDNHNALNTVPNTFKCYKIETRQCLVVSKKITLSLFVFWLYSNLLLLPWTAGNSCKKRSTRQQNQTLCRAATVHGVSRQTALQFMSASVKDQRNRRQVAAPIYRVNRSMILM